jgi:hypothetical protein
MGILAERSKRWSESLVRDNETLNNIAKIVDMKDLEPFLASTYYVTRIGAIRRYEKITGKDCPMKTKKEARFIAQVDDFNRQTFPSLFE